MHSQSATTTQSILNKSDLFGQSLQLRKCQSVTEFVKCNVQCLRHVTLCLSTYHRTVEHMCNKPQPISAQMFHTCKNRKTSWSNWEFCTQMQIFNFISIIKLVSTKQRQMGFTAAFSLLTHCRSKRYRTLLLHITYQEVLKNKIKNKPSSTWMNEQAMMHPISGPITDY